MLPSMVGLLQQTYLRLSALWSQFTRMLPSNRLSQVTAFIERL